MTAIELKVHDYLTALNEGRLLVIRDKPEAKRLFLEAQTILRNIPGEMTTVNTVTEMWAHEDYERKHIGPTMIMRSAVEGLSANLDTHGAGITQWI